jgi:hypothetical protein
MRAIGLVAVLVVGCGGGSSSGSTPVSATDFPARFAAGWCGLVQRCCLASGGASNGTCEADIMTSVATLGTKAMADGATWDGATAGRCLDAIRAADCATANLSALVTLLNTCDDTWLGVVPPGGACMTYASCAEPAVSGGATAGASCVNSMCVPVVRQPIGATCDNTTYVCDPFASGCSGGTCVALPGPGESCTGDCRVGSHCRNGACAALLEMGATCAADSDCTSDKCSGGRCASAFATEAEYCTLP